MCNAVAADGPAYSFSPVLREGRRPAQLWGEFMSVRSWREIALIWAVGLAVAAAAVVTARTIGSRVLARVNSEAVSKASAEGVSPAQSKEVIAIGLTAEDGWRVQRQLRRIELVDTAGAVVALGIFVALAIVTGVWVWSRLRLSPSL